MNYPNKLRSRDRRHESEQRNDLTRLNIIQTALEDSIGSYAIQEPENLFDEKFAQKVRKLEFSRGMKYYEIVIAPDGFIRSITTNFPNRLLTEIHNALIGLETDGR
jgi:hypothetical protein